MLEKLGITELNDMQREAGNAILQGKQDVVVLSPTGSGKTLAYLLPLVQLIDARQDEPQAMVIVPGRELANQSDRVLKNMGSGIRSAACYGGRTTMEEHRRLKEVRPQIIFGTPGRLIDHLDKGNISPYGIRYLVIDEFDKCLEMGFHDEMTRLLKKLPGVCRHILLSATDAEQIPEFVSMGRAVHVDFLSDNEQVSQRVTAYVVKSPLKDKLDKLRQLLCSFGDEKSVVFLGFRNAVERVGDYLRREGFVVSVFHGGMEQKQREDALYKFFNGSANVFVSTDLGSRGLDIPEIQNIIHYHLPLNKEEMIHRIGRTARWDKLGKTFFIIGPEESMPSFVDCDTETYEPMSNDLKPAAPRMATIYIGKGKKNKIAKGDIVGFLCKKGGLEPLDIGRIDVMDRYAYAAVCRQHIEQVLRLTKGEKIKGVKTVIEPVK
jgi:superfamily II DNA/RNA helicase